MASFSAWREIDPFSGTGSMIEELDFSPVDSVVCEPEPVKETGSSDCEECHPLFAIEFRGTVFDESVTMETPASELPENWEPILRQIEEWRSGIMANRQAAKLAGSRLGELPSPV